MCFGHCVWLGLTPSKEVPSALREASIRWGLILTIHRLCLVDVVSSFKLTKVTLVKNNNYAQVKAVDQNDPRQLDTQAEPEVLVRANPVLADEV